MISTASLVELVSGRLSYSATPITNAFLGLEDEDEGKGEGASQMQMDTEIGLRKLHSGQVQLVGFDELKDEEVICDRSRGCFCFFTQYS